MKMLKPSPTHGRNAFDMSCRDVQSYNIGELLPVYCLETVPNDKVVIKPADLLRACPLVTSPFLRMKQHIDFWFVPYQQLWSRWNEFIVDRSEPFSSNLFDKGFVPYFKMADCISAIKNDVSSFSIQNVLGESYGPDAARLLDSLGYPAHSLYYNWSQPDNTMVNPFRLAAYQKIWYTEYRQQYYDDGTLGMQQPFSYDSQVARLFNFDDLGCYSVASADLLGRQLDPTTDYSPFAYLCQLRRRAWKKDLFTGLMPSTQFGAVSNLSVDQGSPLIYATTSGTTVAASTLDATRMYLTIGGAPARPSAQNFDILSLRRSEAIQKWRENALRAGNFVEDNFEAHYGVKPKSHMDTHPIFIGSVDAPINIGDVDVTASTSATVNGAAGDIAGKALSSISGKEFHFQTNDFGVIMGIFSILPEAEYESLGIDRPNQLLERFDFFTPEFENLGLEAVDYHTMSSDYGNGALGYAPRYWGYKTKIDKVHLDFFRQHTGTGGISMDGVFKQWCSPRSVWPQTTPALRNLYVDYRTFQYNFVTTTVKQFLVDMYIDCTAIRPMTISGMPSY